MEIKKFENENIEIFKTEEINNHPFIEIINKEVENIIESEMGVQRIFELQKICSNAKRNKTQSS